jgi:hypothetical protein
MNLLSYFTSAGVPATSLAPIPTISIWGADGTVYATASAMTEIAGGFYRFDFTTYDQNIDYVFQSYASSLATSEQYVIATNDSDSQSTQGIVKQILGLSQGNFIMSAQTYDASGRLETSDMYTYDSQADTDADTNRLHTYNIVANYDGSGNLIKYKVTEA